MHIGVVFSTEEITWHYSTFMQFLESEQFSKQYPGMSVTYHSMGYTFAVYLDKGSDSDRIDDVQSYLSTADQTKLKRLLAQFKLEGAKIQVLSSRELQ